jgi:hypothetical protein
MINPASNDVMLKHRIPANRKASKRRCNTATASFDNPVCWLA